LGAILEAKGAVAVAADVASRAERGHNLEHVPGNDYQTGIEEFPYGAAMLGEVATS